MPSSLSLSLSLTSVSVAGTSLECTVGERVRVAVRRRWISDFGSLEEEEEEEASLEIKESLDAEEEEALDLEAVERGGAFVDGAFGPFPGTEGAGDSGRVMGAEDVADLRDTDEDEDDDDDVEGEEGFDCV